MSWFGSHVKALNITPPPEEMAQQNKKNNINTTAKKLVEKSSGWASGLEEGKRERERALPTWLYFYMVVFFS